MMTTRLAGILVLLLLVWLRETVLADSPLEVVLKQCQLIRITGQFSSTGAKYQTAGQCLKYPTQLLWTGQGAYDPKDGRAQEVIELKGIPPYQGRLTIRATCSADPWIDSKRGGLASPDCSNLAVQAQGEPSVVEPVLNILMGEVRRTSKPLSALYRDYVPYHLDQLRAQHDVELRAEAARAEVEAVKTETQQGKLLQSATQPNVLRVIPTIQTPAAEALFFSNTSVAIKVAPPQGLAVTAYLVRLERRNVQGIWTLVTNLPISAAEAASPAGYTGWGAPGNGPDPSRMVSLPGTYRISAQVSSPRPTGWSQPIEFVVTAPTNAVQKAPKMFGP